MILNFLNLIKEVKNNLLVPNSWEVWELELNHKEWILNTWKKLVKKFLVILVKEVLQMGQVEITWQTIQLLIKEVNKTWCQLVLEKCNQIHKRCLEWMICLWVDQKIWLKEVLYPQDSPKTQVNNLPKIKVHQMSISKECQSDKVSKELILNWKDKVNQSTWSRILHTTQWINLLLLIKNSNKNNQVQCLKEVLDRIEIETKTYQCLWVTMVVSEWEILLVCKVVLEKWDHKTKIKFEVLNSPW